MSATINRNKRGLGSSEERAFTERRLPITAVQEAVLEAEAYLTLFGESLDDERYQRIFKDIFLIRTEICKIGEVNDLFIRELLQDMGSVFDCLPNSKESKKVRMIVYYLLLVPEYSFY